MSLTYPDTVSIQRIITDSFSRAETNNGSAFSNAAYIEDSSKLGLGGDGQPMDDKVEVFLEGNVSISIGDYITITALGDSAEFISVQRKVKSVYAVAGPCDIDHVEVTI